MWLCQNSQVNGLKFKLPSVTLANYGMVVPGKYGQIKKLQIVFTVPYEAYGPKGVSQMPIFLKITPSCCFSHEFFIVSEEITKKIEKSYHLRVDQSIPWFTT